MEKQNLQAENQTNETTQPIIKEKSTLSTRVLFLKNNWKKLVILAAVGIVVVGIIISAIVGVIAISRNIKANNIKKQLNGMTFHRLYGSSYGTDYWYADTWSFEEDGKYIRDDYNYTVSNDDYHKNVLKHDISEGVAEIKVPLFGTPTINTHYEIVFDEFGNIRALRYRRGNGEYSDDEYEVVEESYATQKLKEKLKETAVDVFCELSMWENRNYGEMIRIIYKDYEVTCEAIEGSQTKYLLTFEGDYYPNKKDVPDLTCPGTLAVEVDIEENTGKIITGGYIIDAMYLYDLLSQVW